MTGTEITLKDVKDDLNQILDRLSEIEMILNDPMHGIELPEGVNVDVGEQPTVTMDSMYDMNSTAAVDTIQIATVPTVTMEDSSYNTNNITFSIGSENDS